MRDKGNIIYYSALMWMELLEDLSSTSWLDVRFNTPFQSIYNVLILLLHISYLRNTYFKISTRNIINISLP